MKTELRERYRARRREFSSQAGRLAAPPLNTHLRRLLHDLVGPGTAQVCAYSVQAEEAPVDLDPAWYLPRLEGDDLEFRRPADASALAPNRFGIAEPIPARSTALDPAVPTVVLCPAVAVDFNGGRLGMGKAFYDRFFSRHTRCLRVGVVYHVQTSARPLPADQWDQRLDWVVTEKMILRTSQRSLHPWTSPPP